MLTVNSGLLGPKAITAPQLNGMLLKNTRTATTEQRSCKPALENLRFILPPPLPRTVVESVKGLPFPTGAPSRVRATTEEPTPLNLSHVRILKQRYHNNHKQSKASTRATHLYLILRGYPWNAGCGMDEVSVYCRLWPLRSEASSLDNHPLPTP
jgi:hypothetical protein